MFFSVAALGVLAVASPAAARLGGVEQSRADTTFDSTQMDALLNVMRQEYVVPKNNFYRHSPMSYYDEADMFNTPGVLHTVAGATDVFDLSNRVTGKGYRITTEESGNLINNYDEFTAWAGANLNLAQYNILPRPSLQSDFHWLSTPGLKAGEFRVDTLGSTSPLPFKEVARVLGTYFTHCPAGEIAPTGEVSFRPPVLYAAVLGSRYTKISAGTTVQMLTDPAGNTFVMSALRGINPNTMPPTELPNDQFKMGALNHFVNILNHPSNDNGGWTFGPVLLEEDVEFSCLESKSVPKNKKGLDGIVCKQIQLFVGPSQVAFGLVEIATIPNNGFNSGFPDLVTFNPRASPGQQCSQATLFAEPKE